MAEENKKRPTKRRPLNAGDSVENSVKPLRPAPRRPKFIKKGK